MATTWSKESSTKASSTGSTASTSFQLDSGESFLVKNSSASNIFTIAESSGDVTITGGITVAGASAFDIGDSDKLLLGDGDDLQLYHDGSDSYITNSTGALKLATESSGIAISIGHTTSETTINDNLTVTGTATFTSGVKLSNNIIYASDGGQTITLDTSDNVTILGDLTISGGNITNAITFDSAVTLSSTISINGRTLGSSNLDSDSELAQSTGTGTSNTIFGKNAGDSIASGGNYNTLFGEDAGTAISTGDNNVIVGYDAGDAAVDVDKMVLVGSGAGSSINSADADGTVAIGYNSLADLTEGQFNTAVGTQAGANLSTSDYSTFVGYQAGLGSASTALTGSFNIGIGYRAGYSLESSAANNILIGSTAGLNTTGLRNIMIGSNAGDAQTTANDNIFIGYDAGTASTTGTPNIFIGNYAGDADTTGQKLSLIHI